MDDLCQKIQFFRAQLPENGILIAVSKTKPVELIRKAYDCGHRDFGENKVQELRFKHLALPSSIRWHMIGHLQRNKVKYIAPFIHLIHSVDNEKLLTEINKQAAKNQRVIDILFQIKIAREETKFGLTEEAYRDLTEKYAQNHFPSVRLRGLMGMATNTQDKQQVRSEFARLKSLFDQLKTRFPHIDYLSAGMSGDYPLAIEQGANIIRIGSAIFGKRQ